MTNTRRTWRRSYKLLFWAGALVCVAVVFLLFDDPWIKWLGVPPAILSVFFVIWSDRIAAREYWAEVVALCELNSHLTVDEAQAIVNINNINMSRKERKK